MGICFSALSLNPALDITLRVDGLEQEYNRVIKEQREAAGKAVNVARVMTQFGTECQTLILAGAENSERYCRRLDQDGVPYEVVEVAGEIRENISVVLPDDHMFRLARSGFTVDAGIVEEIRARLARLVKPETILVVAGKNPDGLTFAQYQMLCKTACALGGRLAVDTSSLTQEELFAVKPWMIKPNLQELEQLVGKALPTSDAVWTAMEFCQKQGIENLLVSLGERGVFYAGKGGRFAACVPNVHVKSTVGAGDSTLAGFLLAYAAGLPISACVQVAASFGTASVMRDGTNPPQIEDLRVVYPQVQVESVE